MIKLDKSQNVLKGSLYIVGGVVLLLHAFGIMDEIFNYALVAAAIVMILYGLLKAGFIDKIVQTARSKKESTKK